MSHDLGTVTIFGLSQLGLELELGFLRKVGVKYTKSPKSNYSDCS